MGRPSALFHCVNRLCKAPLDDLTPDLRGVVTCACKTPYTLTAAMKRALANKQQPALPLAG